MTLEVRTWGLRCFSRYRSTKATAAAAAPLSAGGRPSPCGTKRGDLEQPKTRPVPPPPSESFLSDFGNQVELAVETGASADPAPGRRADGGAESYRRVDPVLPGPLAERPRPSLGRGQRPHVQLEELLRPVVVGKSAHVHSHHSPVWTASPPHPE